MKKSKTNSPPFTIILGISLAVLISALDTSIANTILPKISESLQINDASAIYIVMVYHIALAASILTFSNLGEIKGYRKILIFGIIIFTLASFFCGIATSFIGLVTSRFFQGIGAAAILGSNTAIIKMLYPANKIGKGLGINALIIASGFSLGPSIASLTLSFTTLHWLFLINIPVGILSLILISNKIPINENHERKFEIWNNFKIAFAFILLFVGFDFINKNKIFSIILILLGIVIFYNLYHKSKASLHPVFPFDLLAKKIISFSIIATITAFFIQSIAFIALPFILYNIFNFPIHIIGFLIAPWPAIGALIAPFSGSLSDKIAPTKLSIFGLLILSTGIFILYQTLHLTQNSLIVLSMMICGLGFGFFQSPNIKNVMVNVSISRSGSASGLLGIGRILGQALGSVFLSIYISNYGIENWEPIFYFAILAGLIGILFLTNIPKLNI